MLFPKFWGLAHKLAHKISFSLRFWNIISEILLKFLQDLTIDIGFKTRCSCFHDFMLVLWVHRVIIHAFLCYICKLLNFLCKTSSKTLLKLTKLLNIWYNWYSLTHYCDIPVQITGISHISHITCISYCFSTSYIILTPKTYK